nr:uncharacterized protein LOC108125378 isoform X2 [Drosophila bipectinata]
MPAAGRLGADFDHFAAAAREVFVVRRATTTTATHLLKNRSNPQFQVLTSTRRYPRRPPNANFHKETPVNGLQVLFPKSLF